MSLLVSLLVFCIVIGLILWLINYLPLPAPFGMIARVVIVLLALVWLVERMGLLSNAARY